LDFSTRQRRLEVCRREVELNRRLAPDVYLGLAEVTGVDGRPCEHLVVMRRMPEERRLTTQLRYLDGLDDAAFLAMDLEYHGAAQLGARFLDWYAEFAGDPAPAALRHHYIAYRAMVRAKVACLRSEQGDASVHDESREQAQHYADIATRHLRTTEVRLVLVGGLPGTGKSTLSNALAEPLGMMVLSSDRVRKELHGLAPHQSAAVSYQQGLYSPAATELARSAHAELIALHSTTRGDHPAATGTHRVHLRCRRDDQPCPCRPEFPPVARTPDLRWPRPPGRIMPCLHLTLLSSAVERLSWPVSGPNRSLSWRRTYRLSRAFLLTRAVACVTVLRTVSPTWSRGWFSAWLAGVISLLKSDRLCPPME